MPTFSPSNLSQGQFPAKSSVHLIPLESGTAKHSSLSLTLLVIHGTLAASACIVNALFFFVAWKTKDVMLKRPFYYFILQLMVCTTIKALVQMAFVFPSYASQVIAELPRVVAIFLDTLSDYGILFFSTLIVINRIVVFVKLRGTDSLRKNVIYGSSFLCWLLTASVPAIIMALGCTRSYDSISNTSFDVCLGKRSKGATVFGMVATYFVYGLCLLNLVLYIFLLIRIRSGKYRSARKGTKFSSEFFILLQSVSMFALYSLFVLLFALLPLLTLPPDLFFLMTFFSNLISICIAFSHPVFLLVSTLDSRRCLTRLIERVFCLTLPLLAFKKGVSPT